MICNRKFLKFVCAVCVVISLIFIGPPAIFADDDDDAVLTNIKLANTRDDLLTYFTVENAFKEKNIQAIQKGIPASFTYYVSLYRTSSGFFDKEIADIKVKSSVKYNSLKEEYTIVRSWKNESPLITKSLDEAKAWMAEVDNLKVVPLNRLVKGDKYKIQIKAELDKVTLPFALHYVFFFVSFWDFETDWYVINFTY